jgi:hypothetical protein
MLFPPPGPAGQPTKVGFTTYAMWGLCFVVVGVCYALEQRDTPKAASTVPAEVQRVLPSGAYLMSERASQHRLPPWLLTHRGVSDLSSVPSAAQRTAAFRTQAAQNNDRQLGRIFWLGSSSTGQPRPSSFMRLPFGVLLSSCMSGGHDMSSEDQGQKRLALTIVH